MKQSNRSQQLYLVNVSVVIMLLVLVGILAVVLPKPTVSEVEKKRACSKAPVEPAQLVFRRVCRAVRCLLCRHLSAEGAVGVAGIEAGTDAGCSPG